MTLASTHSFRLLTIALSLVLSGTLTVPLAAQGIFDDNLDSGSSSTGDVLGDGGASAAALDPQAEFERANTAAAQLLQDQKFDEALAEFNKVLALDRTFAPAHFGRARCLSELGLLDDAIEAYSRAIVSPGASRYEGLVNDSHVQRGELYLETARFREAADDFAQAIAQNPGDPQSLFLQAKALLRLVLTSPTQGNDQAGQRSLIQAITSLDRAIELDANNGEAYLERGRVLSRIRELDPSIEDLEKAVSILGENSQAAADLGLAFSQRANFESAKSDADDQQVVADLRAAINAINGFLSAAEFGTETKSWEPRDPTNNRAENILMSRAENMIALANELEGEDRNAIYQQAIKDCDQILGGTKDPLELARAHFSSGHAKRMLGDIDGAIDDYTKAVDLFPAYTEAYLRRGICYFHQNEYDEALQDFAAAANDPRNPYQFEPRASYWQGITHAQQGDDLDAIRAYTRALRSSRNFVPAYLNRGLAYMNVGRNDRAIEDFNNVLRRDRQNEQARQFREQAADRLQSEVDNAEMTYDANVGPL